MTSSLRHSPPIKESIFIGLMDPFIGLLLPWRILTLSERGECYGKMVKRTDQIKERIFIGLMDPFIGLLLPWRILTLSERGEC